MTHAFRKTARTFAADQRGAALVEFALVCLLFFFLFFAIIDIGRLGSSHAMAEKAGQIAVRMAVVRPPACAGVPPRHVRPANAAAPLPRFGTSCRAGTNVCAQLAEPIRCTGSTASVTATEIWDRVAPLLPSDARINHLTFVYASDARLGFLGGPFVPMVTVEITPPEFRFVSPLGAMATALGAATAGPDPTIPFRTISVSMPGEDLGHGG